MSHMHAARLEVVLASPVGLDTLDGAEALVLDLLRAGDDEGLGRVAVHLAARADDPSARRILETVARRGGPARSIALRALRAAGAGAQEPAPDARPGADRGPAAGSGASGAPALPASLGPAAAAAPAALPSPALPSRGGPPLATVPSPAAWDAPFEAALADPSPAHLAAAALALADLAGAPLPGITPEARRAVAGRLAMAALDHDGAAQQGLSRLARGLKAL